MKLAVTLILIAASASACGGPSGDPPSSSGLLTVVATTTVFADLVKQVGGDRTEVHALVPKGGDVHTFDPAPSDAIAITGARVVFMNGLGLDDWLVSFMQDTGNADVPIVKLAEGLPGVDYIANEEAANGASNPHLWMSVAYARKYVEVIRSTLDGIDPANAADYDANATAYDGKLAQLDAYVRGQFATIPESDRKLVAFHDAFPYFARDYGIQIVGVVVSAPGQDPSAGQIADLIAAIRAAGVKLILSEVQFPDQLVRQIAADTGAHVVSDLYDDALTDTVSTYDQMIRWDTDKIVEGLR